MIKGQKKKDHSNLGKKGQKLQKNNVAQISVK